MAERERGPHPTLRIKGTKSHSLWGKKIVLGVTGSIAAVKTVELARDLIRHGADVYGVMSEAATEIIHSYTLHYATGHEVITKLMGNIEHVEFLGMEGTADLFIIAPCTANTLNKIATGVSDTPVTAFATTAFGSGIPVIIVPAMHESIYKSPVLIENLEKLRRLGVIVLGPRIEEGLAKIAELDEIILTVEHVLSPKRLEGKRILITSGPTIEPIDPIRIITSRSSGRTGIELAKAAYRQGAEVTLVHSKELNVTGIKELRVETAREMIEVSLDELRTGYDALISAAAISDFTVNPSEVKLSSVGDLQLQLIPTRKLIAEVRDEFPELVIVGFKAETNVSKDELIRRARQKMETYNLHMVVANDVGKGGIGRAENEVYILRKGTEEIKHVNGPKTILAEEIVNELMHLFRS
ncbi:MAG: bifunctional phosphopantothenoylcysteine decarboxylase/phosphopantothenate--cysteine ligase CoaBC [Methanophagales archaeon ANME-1-THS]|nr:MAG: bifunctional phosphopantothenoylcysteine decarboxylase/phosphopantothenate--cysteine ligase CoaBC [Methanophagales archaeon ANME-1-THS]